MIIVRIYQALSEMVVETTARVDHDGIGNPVEPQSFFVGRTFFDVQSAINGDDVGLAVGTMFHRVQMDVAGRFGGLHQLL